MCRVDNCRVEVSNSGNFYDPRLGETLASHRNRPVDAVEIFFILTAAF